MKIKIRKILAKYLGIYVCGLNPHFDTKSNKPNFGGWVYCNDCKWFDFTNIYDPWSYNCHAVCENCKNNIPIGARQIVGLSPSYLDFKSKILYLRPENKNKKLSYVKILLAHIKDDEIPLNQNGKTLAELETSATIKIMNIFFYTDIS